MLGTFVGLRAAGMNEPPIHPHGDDLDFPTTSLSDFFQLTIVDNTRSVGSDVTGTIRVNYVLPEYIDLPQARKLVNSTCHAQQRPAAIRMADYEWYKQQKCEMSDEPAAVRRVRYTIHFGSEGNDVKGGTEAEHRQYAIERDSYITPVSYQSLGAALYLAETRLDLMKGYAVRAAVSTDSSDGCVAFENHSANGIRVNLLRGSIYGDSRLVVALSSD